MSLRRLQLPSGVSGQVWLGPMPGRFESWSAFEAHVQRAAIGLVVCLTPRPELAELSPEYHAALVRGRLPFRWLHVPMRNFGLPEDPAAFRRDIHVIADAARNGTGVLLHCAAGMGRTGAAAACVLKALGLETAESVQRVREAGSNPQNAEQSGLVDWF